MCFVARLIFAEAVADERDASCVVGQRDVSVQRGCWRRRLHRAFLFGLRYRRAPDRPERGVCPDFAALDVVTDQDSKPVILIVIVAIDRQPHERRAGLERQADGDVGDELHLTARRIMNAESKRDLTAQRSTMDSTHAGEANVAVPRPRSRRVEIAGVGFVQE